MYWILRPLASEICDAIGPTLIASGPVTVYAFPTCSSVVST